MIELLNDKFHEECGVFGIYGHTEAARFNFPRQPQGRRLCISDFYRKKEAALQNGFDVLAVSLVIPPARWAPRWKCRRASPCN